MQAIDSTLARVMMASSDAKVLDFVDRGAAEREWRDAALFSNSTVVATVEELPRSQRRDDGAAAAAD